MIHNLQVKQALLQRCLEVEQAAKDQATDNAILDQLYKVSFRFLFSIQQLHLANTNMEAIPSDHVLFD